MSLSTSREQTSAMTQRASDFVVETQRVLDSLSLLLESPGRNTDHAYAEMVRLTAQVRDTSQVYAEHLALTAYQEPAALSLRRLSSALGMSVNTFRRRLTALADSADDPFAPTEGGDDR